MATTQATGFEDKAFKGMSRQLCVLDVSHAVTVAELETDDVIELGYIPKGATYVGGYLATGDLDGGAGLNLVIGDSADDDGLLLPGSAGQAAGITQLNGAYISGAATTAKDELVTLKVNAGAATPQAGNIRAVIYYYVR